MRKLAKKKDTAHITIWNSRSGTRRDLSMDGTG
jgi:hypothetical protein